MSPHDIGSLRVWITRTDGEWYANCMEIAVYAHMDKPTSYDSLLGVIHSYIEHKSMLLTMPVHSEIWHKFLVAASEGEISFMDKRFPSPMIRKLGFSSVDFYALRADAIAALRSQAKKVG